MPHSSLPEDQASLQAIDRKLRLFACACYREYGPYQIQEVWAFLLRLERFADGLFPEPELRRVNRVAVQAALNRDSGKTFSVPFYTLWRMGSPWIANNIQEIVQGILRDQESLSKSVIESSMCAMLRDLFGSLNGLPEFLPEWTKFRGQIVRQLATSIYQQRQMNDIAIIADVLEEAGCTDETILDHCRQDQRHYLGCWVIDQLLGRHWPDHFLDK